MRLTYFFLSILFFSLPLFHAQFLGYFGITHSFSVSGTFEFTKTILFEFLMFFVFVSFVTEAYIQKKTIVFPKPLIAPSIVVCFSLCVNTFFSLVPWESLFGTPQKWHGLVLWIDLFLLAIVLYNTPTTFLKRLISLSLMSLSIVLVVSLKELLFPSFDYGELGERALGTFGHPNYLACYILVFLPFLLRKIIKSDNTQLLNKGTLSPLEKGGWGNLFIHFFQKWCIIRILFTLLTFLSFVVLLLTKSAWWIFLGFSYLIYFLLSQKYSIKKSLLLTFIFSSWLILLLAVWLHFSIAPIEKLHSFLSRWYIWETTLHILVSSPKLFFLWGWLESLPYFFSSFKVPEMYLYENFGFTADRVHNIFLAFFYHLWILWVISMSYFVFHLKNMLWNVSWKYREICFLFFAFWVFHFFSITAYILIVLFLALVLQKNTSKNISLPLSWIIIFSLVSLCVSYTSVLSYQAEIYAYAWKYQKAYETFPRETYLSEYSLIKKGNSKIFYKNQIQNLEQVEKNCISYTQSFPSVENYFYCGNILEKLGYDLLAREYYHAGLEKLPDIWNEDSPYWDDFFIRNTISGNRFFSEKFSDISEILKKIP